MDDNLNENIKVEDLTEKSNSNNKRFYIIISVPLSIILIITIIFLIIYLREEDKEENSKQKDPERDNTNKEDLNNIPNCLQYENHKCLICDKGYELLNGTCDPIFSFMAIYESLENENVNLINNKYKHNIIKMEIDEEIINPTINYTFKSAGNHSVNALIDTSELKKLDDMFKEKENIISIKFTSKFDTKNITSIRNMFYGCILLTSIDITHFNTQNIGDLGYTFNGCSSLASINLLILIIVL